MKELLTYIGEVAILLCCLYGLYKVLFARDSFHAIKRMIITLGCITAFTLPLAKITIYEEVAAPTTLPQQKIVMASPNEATDEPQPWQVTTPATPFDWMLLIGVIYLAGAIAMLTYRTIGIIGVARILRKSRYLATYSGIKAYICPAQIPPFCFGRKIIISEVESADDLNIIINHELSHIAHRHNIDLMMANIIQAAMWFNPAIWLLRKELILLHEFQADCGVLQKGIDTKKYQFLLISRVAALDRLQPVVNYFGGSQLGKRITMMKKRSSKVSKLKLLALLPLLGAGVMALANTVHYSTQPATEPQIDSLVMPYSGKIVGKFGEQIDPITKKVRQHDGIDVITDCDTIRAMTKGKVLFAGYTKEGGFGNLLTISYANNEKISISLAHLEKILVVEGELVKRNQPIAIVGKTGRAKGKHLHLECRQDGQLVDPATILPIK